MINYILTFAIRKSASARGDWRPSFVVDVVGAASSIVAVIQPIRPETVASCPFLAEAVGELAAGGAAVDHVVAVVEAAATSCGWQLHLVAV